MAFASELHQTVLPMSILVEQPRHTDGTRKDVYIADSRIEAIGNVPEKQQASADRTIDASNMLIAPSFTNGHSHAAMTLMRGWADDLPLETWLKEKIWPVEERLSPEDIYWGTRLACLEMIKSGTTHFNDMYWEFEQICEAVTDSGIRAHVSGVFIDQFDEEVARDQIEQSKRNAELIENYPDRVRFALGPHAVYTVSPESLEWASGYSRDQGVPMNIHLAETRQDVENCREEHGCSPVEYLDRHGGLHKQTVIAHGLWVTDDDIELIADRNARVVYNPVANLKLASGLDFPYDTYREAGVPIMLGTDGVASNNNHDLFEEIKTAALLQKQVQDDPSALPAREAFELATKTPAEIFDLPIGRLAEGALADVMLLDLSHPSLSPVHDAYSLLTYAASGGAVDTVICNGEVIMEDRTVDGEEKVRDRAGEHAQKLVSSV